MLVNHYNCFVKKLIFDQNRSKMIRESVSIVDNRVPLLVGTAAENTYDAIKYSVEAQAKNAEADRVKLGEVSRKEDIV